MCRFKINQRDILESVERVTKTTDRDWQIFYEPTDAGYEKGMEELQQGNVTGL